MNCAQLAFTEISGGVLGTLVQEWGLGRSPAQDLTLQVHNWWILPMNLYAYKMYRY
jgi:hypothetical protein